MILFLPFLFDELVKFEDKRVLTESRQGSCSCFTFLPFSQQKSVIRAKDIKKYFKRKVFKDKRVLIDSLLPAKSLFKAKGIKKESLKKYLKGISFIHILYLNPSAVNWPLSNA